MQTPISITAIASISSLGTSLDTIWKAYQNDKHYFKTKSFLNTMEWISELPLHIKSKINTLRLSNTKYNPLDNSVLFAIYASRKAIKQAGWNTKDHFGINIGSSRGATKLFEKNHKYFLEHKRAKTLSSPTTTLGNISSWVAHDLKSQGPEISHSITCSTALHAVLNGIAWIGSGMCDTFLVGGSEAPLTAFTIAQMKALHIYKTFKHNKESYPCMALDLDKKENTMILGEAAVVACLEKGISKNALAVIQGYGYATDVLQHGASISTDAICFQRSMKMALGNLNSKSIDAIITHSPGTIKGDEAEIQAIKAVFGNNHPSITNNKWKVGHTLATSGMINIEMAILMFKHHHYINIPFLKIQQPKHLQYILVNAVGFGGNAVSIILKHPNC